MSSHRPLGSLEGMVAIVTGAHGGVGRAAVNLFAELGATVVASDRHATNCAESSGADTYVSADLCDPEQAACLIRTVENRYARIDVLFNNAAVGPSATGPFSMANVVDSTAENWEAILRVNLISVGLLCAAAIPGMAARGTGSIVNNASINAVVGVLGADVYTAAKGGVVALTRAMATEWGRAGLRVNAICPGPIDTPMNRPYLEDPARSVSMLARTPLGRVATADEIAQAAAFLASESSSYINGAVIPVDGGWTAC